MNINRLMKRIVLMSIGLIFMSGMVWSYQRAMGYLDLDVRPEKAKVFVDGKERGVCDDFDGFPDYLYLSVGKHTIRFSLEGYLTYERQIEVKADQEIEFNTVLVPLPADEQKGEKADANVEVFDFQKLKEIQRKKKHTEQATEDDEDRRAGSRYRTHSGAKENSGNTGKEPIEKGNAEFTKEASMHPEEQKVASEKPDTANDREDSTGSVSIRIFPDDAVLYIDGLFQGTGESLRGHIVNLSQGKHSFIVMKPGYQTAKETLTIVSGEQKHFRIALIKLD